MKEEVWIVYASVGGGHKAAALSLLESLQHSCKKVRLFDILDFAPKAMKRVYSEVHLKSMRYAPKYYHTAFERTNHRGGLSEHVRHLFDYTMFSRFMEALEKEQPSHVIGTHHLPLLLASHAKEMGSFQGSLMGVVTDYCAHAFWAEPYVDQFLVPDPSCAYELVNHGIPYEKMTIGNIPVFSSFFEVSPFDEPKKSEALRVLLSGGGFGVGPLLSALSSFQTSDPVELRIICGASKKLRMQVEKLVKRKNLNAEVFGYESQMSAHIAWSHVCVGKAGGLSLSECFAAGRPFVIIGEARGQELRNQMYAVSHGAGIFLETKALASSLNRMTEAKMWGEMAKKSRALGQKKAAQEGHLYTEIKKAS